MMETRIEAFWESFKKAKEDCLQMIEKYFSEHEEDLKRKIKNEESKLGFKNEENLKQILENIFIEEEKIQECLVRLENTKSPALIKEIHLEVLPSLDAILKTVSHEIEKVPQFQLKLNYKKPNLL